jgi:hypothetical protein
MGRLIYQFSGEIVKTSIGYSNHFTYSSFDKYHNSGSNKTPQKRNLPIISFSPKHLNISTSQQPPPPSFLSHHIIPTKPKLTRFIFPFSDPFPFPPFSVLVFPFGDLIDLVEVDGVCVCDDDDDGSDAMFPFVSPILFRDVRVLSLSHTHTLSLSVPDDVGD